MPLAQTRFIRLQIPPIIDHDLLPLLVDRILVPMRQVSDEPDHVLRAFAEGHILAASRAGQDEVCIKHVKSISA